MSWLSASANSTPTPGTWLTCCARAFSGHAASGRRLGEEFAGPTQPRDHPQILAIRYIREMMAGHAVEFSKHQCLPRGIYDAHAAENWSGSTDSGVTTGIEVGRIRHVRLSRRRWLVQVSVRQKRARSIGPNATGASKSRSILRRTSLALNGWVTQRRALGGGWLAYALHAEQ